MISLPMNGSATVISSWVWHWLSNIALSSLLPSLKPLMTFSTGLIREMGSVGPTIPGRFKVVSQFWKLVYSPVRDNIGLRNKSSSNHYRWRTPFAEMEIIKQLSFLSTTDMIWIFSLVTVGTGLFVICGKRVVDKHHLVRSVRYMRQYKTKRVTSETWRGKSF